jgi:hypothetical protein
MTVQPGRRLTGRTFDEVEAEVKREHHLVQEGLEFLDNLCHIKIYRDREGWGPTVHHYTALDFDDADDFAREDFRAEDWVYHDTTVPAAATSAIEDLNEIDKALHDANKRLFSKDDIQVAVSFAVGRFYYSNPDSHKIAGEVLKRLGF